LRAATGPLHLRPARLRYPPTTSDGRCFIPLRRHFIVVSILKTFLQEKAEETTKQIKGERRKKQKTPQA
jgi:hypothetical protein